MTDEDNWYEVFKCERCEEICTRLKDSFDSNVCAECQMWDKIDERTNNG